MYSYNSENYQHFILYDDDEEHELLWKMQNETIKRKENFMLLSNKIF